MNPVRNKLTDRFSQHNWSWVVPIAGATVVYAGHLLTHPYPSLGGGLFLLVAERLPEQGFAFPTHVPYYSTDGVPFAYPPLMFYAIAALLELGFEPLAIARFLPGLLFVIAISAAYLVANEVLADEYRATVASLVLATSPTLYYWHISAGGMVRSGALLFSFAGCYTGLRLFKTRRWQWVVPSTLLFSLTVLAHPEYILFFVTSYLVFFAWFDRSVRGFLLGAAVGLGGVLLAAPWWFSVGSTHGFDIFASVAGTHSGTVTLLQPIRFITLIRTTFLPIWPALAVVGGIYLLVTRRLFFPVWFIAVAIVTGRLRFLIFIGGFMAVVLVFEALVPAVRSRPDRRILDNVGPHAIVGLLVLYSVANGVVFAAGNPIVEADDPLPMYIDEDDVAAMEWVSRNTQENATFVVLGDTEEWLPLFSQRTVLITPRGTEWEGAEQWRLHRDVYYSLSTCLDEICLNRILERNDVEPEYVYVSREGAFSISAEVSELRWRTLRADLRRSQNFRIVYQNDGAIIARRT